MIQNTKFQRSKSLFNSALADDNIEECFKILRKDFLLSDIQQKDLTLLERKFNHARKEKRINTIDFDKFSMEISQVAKSLLELFNEIKEDDISLSEKTNERILVFACKKSPTDWEKLFPEAFFSHVQIIQYGNEVPAAFSSPDVVIFDDLDCPGIGNTAQMRILAKSMPGANLLYYGPSNENPFKDTTAEEDKAIYARMTNANSKFTVHARLRELLEFRKIYGVP